MKKLLWIDLETNGLEPRYNNILASGLVVTDQDLNVIAEQEWIIHWYPDLWENANPIARKMHIDNGLWSMIKKSSLDLGDIEQEMLDFVDRHFAPDEQITLAGNSIHFDRSFIAQNMPFFYERFHYRQVDVSSLKILVNLWSPGQEFVSEKPKHLPLADISGSINELKYYKKLLWGK